MQYRNILISSAKDVSIKNNQLVIDRNDNIFFSMEDINCIIIENPYTNLSAYVIRELAKNEIVVYVCDEKHIPSAVLLPIVKHSRHFKMLKNQIGATKPLNKQIWQNIVSTKIYNQARCLEVLHIEGFETLYAMGKEVKSGDTTHVEAKAAAFYFKKLFGDDFARQNDEVVNAMLNYGYAIIRGMICRTIVAYGFEPSIGIWHKSELNSYNLADDFIEPFRPFVDLYIVSNMDISKEKFEASDKRIIIHMLDYDLKLNNENRVIKNCIDIFVSSYSSSLQKGKNEIYIPILDELREHRYE